MAKTTQYTIALKEEVSASLRNIEAKLANTNQKMGEMATAGSKAFDVVKVGAYGAAAVAALGQIADFTGAAVKAYGDFEEKQLRLQAQLKVSGNQIGLTAQQIMGLASALEDATGIDDSNILDAVATMQTFQNVTGEAFKEAIAQAANMSVVFGDIDTAAKQLGAALENPAENLDKLKKASVYFTDAEKEQIKAMQEAGNLAEAQAMVLDKVKEKYDGLAESINTGVNGAIRGLTNAWDDFMKFVGQGIGTVLAPQISALAGLIKTLTPPTSTGPAKTTGTRDGFRSIVAGDAEAEKGAEEFLAQVQAMAEKARKELAATAAESARLQALWSSSTTKLPAFIAAPTGPSVDSGYTVTGGGSLPETIGYLEEGRALLADNSSMADSVAKLADDTFTNYEKSLTPLESMLDTLTKSRDVIDSMMMAWREVSKITGLLADQDAQRSQAAIDRQKADLDEYTAAQDLKIEIAKRNGEDTTQMEVDKASEVYARKKELAEDERKAKREAWAANKAASLTQIAMTGAEAVMKAWTLLPPFNLIQAGLAGASTAAQLAIVAGQSMPAFARGGVVPGYSYSGDSVLARLNSGEMVLNGRQQANLLAVASGGGGGGPRIHIERVYGTVDQDFLDELERSQALRGYRGVTA
jgi:hypothetical protein